MPSYCERCGIHVPDGMPACRMCGSTALSSQHFGSASGAIPTGRLQREQASLPKWLIVVALGLVVTPILRLHTIFSILIPELNVDQYQPYFDAHPGLRNLLYGEIALNVILILAAIVLNYLFYTKSRRFPAFMIAYAVSTFAYMLAVTGAVRLVYPDADMSRSFMPLVRSLIWVGLLIPYLLLAPEVKGRFVD